ncbi:MAG: HNH endonuclease [Patescibacteria group bacterium]|nr:HNH endonuclease [Patescibacteria group bacterium]
MRKIRKPHQFYYAQRFDQEKFWMRVDVHGSIPTHVPEIGNCWEWAGPLGNKGYGRISIKPGKYITTHRLAWMLSRGDTNGLLVCHKCDNRRCCRPDHLFLGTHYDNAHDAIDKGRIDPMAIGNRLREKTHCVRGHALEGDNVIRVPKGRQCRECYRMHYHNYNAKKSEKRRLVREAQ